MWSTQDVWSSNEYQIGIIRFRTQTTTTSTTTNYADITCHVWTHNMASYRVIANDATVIACILNHWQVMTYRPVDWSQSYMWYTCASILSSRICECTRNDQIVLQFDTLSKKLIFLTVDWTNTVLHYVMYTDKLIASFVVMTSSWLGMLNEVRKFKLRKKYSNSNSFYDPSKFDFQIPFSLNSTNQ